MRIYVKVSNEWITLATGDGDETLRWLAEEAVKKYTKMRELQADQVGRVISIRRSANNALLDPDDTLSTVLNDNDYVSLDLSTDQQKKKHVDTEHKQELYSGEVILPHDHTTAKTQDMFLDGDTLTPEDLVAMGTGAYTIKLTEDAWKKVKDSRRLVDEIVAENKVVYGITTGFGKFASTIIDKSRLRDLQESLVRSHSAGVGKPLSLHATRMLMALRINALAKGYSGISAETLQKLIDMFNASCLPWIPEKGTVGASGDLAPLAHMALGLIGEGRLWSPNTGWTEARNALEENGLSPALLLPKEGLCLINGTQFITSIGAHALYRAEMISKQADVIAALTLEICKGTTRAFDAEVQLCRPHRGQIEVARRLRSLLHSDMFPSEISESHRFCHRVQDAYTVRCCPQVHGIVKDTIAFVRGIILTEMNSATDNPLVFSDRGMIISAGNFHGEYPAKALDYLAIGVHELANMSERRIERLVNPAYSELPAFITKDGGVNSGFMIAHVVAASLVSENKVLCHPASVDSLTTSAGQEDHVSMGGFAARKALQVVEHVEQVLAIELLAAAQSIEFLRPLKTTAPLEAVIRVVRSVVPAWERDRFMSPDIEAATRLLRRGQVWDIVKPYMEEYESAQVTDLWIASPTTTSLRQVVNASGGRKRKANTRKSSVATIEPFKKQGKHDAN